MSDQRYVLAWVMGRARQFKEIDGVERPLWTYKEIADKLLQTEKVDLGHGRVRRMVEGNDPELAAKRAAAPKPTKAQAAEIRRSRKGGSVKGVPKKEITLAMRRANRARGFRHGKRALAVTVVEVQETRLQQLSKKDPGAAQLWEAYRKAFQQGDLSETDMIAIEGMVDKVLRRRQMNDAIDGDGVTLRKPIFDANGRKAGEEVYEHPLLRRVEAQDKDLGLNAQDMLLTRKSRGDMATNAAIASALARDKLLRSIPKDDMPPPE